MWFCFVFLPNFFFPCSEKILYLSAALKEDPVVCETRGGAKVSVIINPRLNHSLRIPQVYQFHLSCIIGQFVPGAEVYRRVHMNALSVPAVVVESSCQTLSPTYSIWHPHTTLPSLSLDKTNRIATCLCSRRELKPLHCHRKCHTRQTLLKRLTAASVRGQKLKREKRKLACTYTRTVKVTLTRHDGTAHQR